MVYSRLKILFSLVFFVALAGCRDTGNKITGWLSESLGRSEITTEQTAITLVEGQSSTIDLKFNQPVKEDTDLNWTITAPSNAFSTVTGTVHLVKGVTSASFDIQSTDNTTLEGNRSYGLMIGGSLTDFSNSLAIDINLIDNESPPLLSISDITVIEGTGAGSTDAVFTVQLSHASTQDITVDYAMGGGSAHAGVDYTAASGTLTIAAGTLQGEIHVSVTRDNLYEPAETFFMQLSGGTGYTVSGSILSAQATINDDDGRPSLSIGDAAIIEGNSGQTNLNATVTLSQVSAVPVTVQYATQDQTAVAPSDYSATSGTLTIAAGATSGTISIPVQGDTRLENDETFSIQLLAGTGYEASTSQLSAVFTIENDDIGPTISVANVSAFENAGLLSFTVSASAGSDLPITVNYATQDQTATASADYTSVSGTVTIPAGATSAAVNVSLTDDALYETDETLILNLSGGSGYTLAGSQVSAIGTIRNDDSAPTISIANRSSNEGDTGTSSMTFTISLSSASAVPVTVNYATSNGTATSGSDYASTSGSATIAAGATSTSFNVTINGDVVFEENETFTVTLSGGSGYSATGSTLSATGTITNDDSAPSLSLADASISEGNSGTKTLSFTASLSSASDLPVTFNFATSDVTAIAGSDYVAATGSRTIAAGATSTTVQVTVSGDTIFENDETFTVTLSGGSGYNATGSTLSASGTITNDDLAPTISIADRSVTEGNSGQTNITFTVTASAVSALPISVNYASSETSATAGTDYTAASGTVTIAAGSTTATFNVAVTGDVLFETDETFLVTLSAGSGYTASGSTLTATGTIVDDDASPTISIADAAVNEGNSGTTALAFTVSLSSASAVPVSVNFVTSNGTAVAGSDYTASSGALTFAAGETSKTITVNVTGETLFETDETFNVTLSGGSGYTATGSQLTAIGTITNDDSGPTISISNISANEAAGTATFTVTASTVSARDITFDFASANDSATSPSDYTAVSGSKTIAAGSTTATIAVSIVQDSLHEADETFKITLSGGSGYTSSGSTLTATATIVDDDAAPTISIANVSVTEGSGPGTTNAVFTVSANSISGLPIVVDYTTLLTGTATSGTDFTYTAGMLTIAAGSTSATFSVPITRDSIYEANEVFNVSLSGGSGYQTMGSTLNASATIDDDDAAPTISIANVSITEGDTGSKNLAFTVTASQTSEVAIVVNYATSDYTATAASDYSSASGTLTIPAGSTSGTFNVSVLGDTLYEADETFLVTLTAGSGFTTTGSTLFAYGYILNDDTAPTISVADVSVTEGTGAGTTNAVFTVAASKSSALPIVINYATSDVTATAPSDYTATNGTLTIAAGSTTGTISVPIVRDSNYEQNETFTLTLSAGSGSTATGSTLTATGTIVNDDSTTKLWDFTDSSVLPSNFTFDPKYISFTAGGGVKLKTVDTVHDSSAEFAGTNLGTTYSSSVLTLSPSAASDMNLSGSWAPQRSSMVVHLRMENNFQDSSGKNNNGTAVGVTGVPGFSTASKVGTYAGSFIGANSQKVVIADADNLDNSSKMSFSFWMNAATIDGAARGLISKRNDSSDNNAYGIFFYTGNKISIDIAGSDNRFSTTTIFVPHRWYHVAVVYDGTLTFGNRSKVYVDGKIDQTSGENSTTLSNLNSALAIGQLTSNGYFDGRMDEVGIWQGAALSANDVALIYNTQKQKYSGQYDSTVIDLGSTTAPWPNIAATTSLPFGKVIAGNSVSESSSDYAGVSANLSTGLITHLSFDTLSTGSIATGTNIPDDSSSTLNASASGGATVTDGLLGKAYSTTSATNGINLANLGSKFNSDEGTISVWVQREFARDDASHHTIFQATQNSTNRIFLYYHATSKTFRFTREIAGVVTEPTAISDANFPLGGWHHIAYAYSKADNAIRTYFDGKLVDTTITGVTSFATPPTTFSFGGIGSNAWYGKMDEAAIWTRALSANEILQLYRRAANRVKYQVRSCATNPCTEASEPFVGPDGTASSYYSELQNNSALTSAGVPTGTAQASGLNINWTTTPYSSLSKPAANRYFQYRVVLESDDENALCSGSPCLPSVSTVSVGPQGRYFGGSPSITNSSGTLPATLLYEMSKADNPGACTTYQISKDGGATWLYYNTTTSAWTTTSAGAANSNYLSDFTQARFASLGAVTSFRYKAFLSSSSDLTAACTLNWVNLQYQQ